MVNEYNIEMPVYWEAVPEDYNWLTIDSDGAIHAFFYKPIFYQSKRWVANTPNHWIKFAHVEPPIDPSKCIWGRNILRELANNIIENISKIKKKGLP